MSVIDRLAMTLRNAITGLRMLPLRHKLVAASVAVAGGLGLIWLSGAGTGCATRGEAEARASLVSSGLQLAATQGSLEIERLAAGVKRMNQAATAYEADKDHAAFCAALDTLSDEFSLDR